MTIKSNAWKFISGINWYLPTGDLYLNTRNGILNYHSISTANSGLSCEISLDRFRRDLKYLTENFDIVDIPELLTGSIKGQKQLAITFDDGFSNFYSNALPVLQEFNIPATIFINYNFIGDSHIGKIRERHNVKQVSRPITMDREQINGLVDSDLVTVGNHTLTHRNLSAVRDRDILEEEIIGGKRALEDEFGISVDRFAYPYGQYNEIAAEVVRESHSFGVGTRWSLLTENYETHKLPRIGAHTSEKMVRWELSDISHQIRVATDRLSL
ncbi:polysaccharide deacetylase family protein [Halorubrum ezzemoulense]|uniref:polysaccharide deacetylase family protein n=1 Tax=Halorubrum ezzemoulense TaxID=337243 RepID=UPI0034E0D2A2